MKLYKRGKDDRPAGVELRDGTYIELEELLVTTIEILEHAGILVEKDLKEKPDVVPH